MKRSRVNPYVDPGDAIASATSTDLLRRARANDQSAWEQLVRQYSRRMYRWCRRAGLQPADSSNVVQEAIGAVAKSLEQFRRDRPGDTFRGWLRRITDNKIRDHYRRLGRSVDVAVGGSDAHQRLTRFAKPSSADQLQEMVSDEVLHDPTQESDHKQEGQAAKSPLPITHLEEVIDSVRNEVSARNWRIFWRIVVDGQPAAEVAQEFSITANAARLVKMRVLRRLRNCLEEE